MTSYRPAETAADLILGPWYWIKPDMPPDRVHYKQVSLTLFKKDQVFEEHDIRNYPKVSLKRSSNYLYDGRFLVIMTKSSKTYRVKRIHPWLWQLDDGTSQFQLTRVFYLNRILTEVQPKTVDGVNPEEVRLEHPFGNIGTFEVYADQQMQIYLGSVYLHTNSSVAMDIGVCSAVKGLSEETWQHIIRTQIVPELRPLTDISAFRFFVEEISSACGG